MDLSKQQGESLLDAIVIVSAAYQEQKMINRGNRVFDLEKLAEAAHNAWLAEKQARGVTTWVNERGFEQMVPYSECPEDIKEFDRIVVSAITEALVKEIERE